MDDDRQKKTAGQRLRAAAARVWPAALGVTAVGLAMLWNRFP